MTSFPNSKQRKITKIFTMFDTFEQFKYFDEVIWNKLMDFMDNKGGWIRTVIIEKIYPYTGTFPRAK
jgi:hypothetical protein